MSNNSKQKNILLSLDSKDNLSYTSQQNTVSTRSTGTDSTQVNSHSFNNAFQQLVDNDLAVQMAIEQMKSTNDGIGVFSNEDIESAPNGYKVLDPDSSDEFQILRKRKKSVNETVSKNENVSEHTSFVTEINGKIYVGFEYGLADITNNGFIPVDSDMGGIQECKAYCQAKDEHFFAFETHGIYSLLQGNSENGTYDKLVFRSGDVDSGIKTMYYNPEDERIYIGTDSGAYSAKYTGANAVLSFKMVPMRDKSGNDYDDTQINGFVNLGLNQEVGRGLSLVSIAADGVFRSVHGYDATNTQTSMRNTDCRFTCVIQSKTYVGTDKGLFILDEDEPVFGVDRPIHAMFDDGLNIYVATEDQIHRINVVTQNHVTVNVESTPIRMFVSSEDENIVVWNDGNDFIYSTFLEDGTTRMSEHVGKLCITGKESEILNIYDENGISSSVDFGFQSVYTPNVKNVSDYKIQNVDYSGKNVFYSQNMSGTEYVFTSDGIFTQNYRPYGLPDTSKHLTLKWDQYGHALMSQGELVLLKEDLGQMFSPGIKADLIGQTDDNILIAKGRTISAYSKITQRLEDCGTVPGQVLGFAHEGECSWIFANRELYITDDFPKIYESEHAPSGYHVGAIENVQLAYIQGTEALVQTASNDGNLSVVCEHAVYDEEQDKTDFYSKTVFDGSANGLYCSENILNLLKNDGITQYILSGSGNDVQMISGGTFANGYDISSYTTDSSGGKFASTRDGKLLKIYPEYERLSDVLGESDKVELYTTMYGYSVFVVDGGRTIKVFKNEGFVDECEITCEDAVSDIQIVNIATGTNDEQIFLAYSHGNSVSFFDISNRETHDVEIVEASEIYKLELEYTMRGPVYAKTDTGIFKITLDPEEEYPQYQTFVSDDITQDSKFAIFDSEIYAYSNGGTVTFVYGEDSREKSVGGNVERIVVQKNSNGKFRLLVFYNDSGEVKLGVKEDITDEYEGTWNDDVLGLGANPKVFGQYVQLEEDNAVYRINDAIYDVEDEEDNEDGEFVIHNKHLYNLDCSIPSEDNPLSSDENIIFVGDGMIVTDRSLYMLDPFKVSEVELEDDLKVSDIKLDEGNLFAISRNNDQQNLVSVDISTGRYDVLVQDVKCFQVSEGTIKYVVIGNENIVETYGSGIDMYDYDPPCKIISILDDVTVESSTFQSIYRCSYAIGGCCTDEGLKYYNETDKKPVVRQVPTTNDPISYQITGLRECGGTSYAFTNTKILRLSIDGFTKTQVFATDSDNYIQDIYVIDNIFLVKSGNKWFSCSTGSWSERYELNIGDCDINTVRPCDGGVILYLSTGIKKIQFTEDKILFIDDVNVNLFNYEIFNIAKSRDGNALIEGRSEGKIVSELVTFDQDGKLVRNGDSYVDFGNDSVRVSYYEFDSVNRHVLVQKSDNTFVIYTINPDGVKSLKYYDKRLVGCKLNGFMYHGTYIFLTEKGYMISDGSGSTLEFERVDSKSEINNDSCNDIVKIDDKRYIIATDSGLYSFTNDGRKLENSAQKIRTFESGVQKLTDVSGSGSGPFLCSSGNKIFQSKTGVRWTEFLNLDIEASIVNGMFALDQDTIYFSTIVGLYQTSQTYELVKDIDRLTLSRVREILDEMGGTIQSHVDEKLDEHENVMHRYDDGAKNVVPILNNECVDVEFNGFVSTGNVNIVRSVQSGDEYEGNITARYRNFLTDGQYVKTGCSYILKRYLSGMFELYVYIPTTGTYYLNRIPQIPGCNYENGLNDRQNLKKFGEKFVGIDVNPSTNHTLFEIKIDETFMIIDDVISIDANGNSLPLKIYIQRDDNAEDYDGTAMFNTMLYPTVCRSRPGIVEKDGTGNYVFKFACFGSDAQAVKIIGMETPMIDKVVVRFHGGEGDGNMPNQMFTIGEYQKLSANSFVWKSERKRFYGWATQPNVTDSNISMFTKIYRDEESIVFNGDQVKPGDFIDLYAVWTSNEIDNDATVIYLYDTEGSEFYIENGTPHIRNTDITIDYGE